METKKRYEGQISEGQRFRHPNGVSTFTIAIGSTKYHFDQCSMQLRDGGWHPDVPAESAPEATPAQRRLAAGWTPISPGAINVECENCGSFCVAMDAQRVTYCELCADYRGAFAEPARYAVGVDWGSKDRSAEVVIDRATGQVVSERTTPARCSCGHAAHTGICTGPSAFGHEACPCPVGRVATVPKHKRPIVGTYKSHSHGLLAAEAALMLKYDTVNGERPFLEMLAREKPQPEPARPKGGFLTARIGGGR